MGSHESHGSISTAILTAIRGKSSRFLVCGIAVALLCWLPARPLMAAVFTVDSTIDATDAVPGDGLCDDGAGVCTLRAAVMEANWLSGADIIDLPSGSYTLSLAGAAEDGAATGDLDVTGDLTLSGAGAGTTIIDGGALDTVIHIDPSQAGVTVVMSDITIQSGSNPAGAYGGGGILNRGNLTLTNCTISDSVALWSGGGISNQGGTLSLTACSISGNSSTSGSGGGIVNGANSTLVMTDSTIDGNTTGSQGGAGLANWGTASLSGCTVTGNSITTTSGTAGIMHGSGSLTIDDSTIASNNGVNGTGGIEARGGTVTITGSTISSNQGARGVFVRYSSTALTLVNSTVSGNFGGLYNGGGVKVESSAVLNLHNATIAFNQGPTSQYAAPNSGGVTVDSAVVNLRNSVIASNTSATGQPDCLGTLASEGYNLVGSLAGCTITGDTTGNLTGSARLLPLTDNGGLTLTHALGTMSPAIDSANPATPGSGGTACEAADQRHVVRPLDGDGDASARCDMGAYETSHEAFTFTVTTTDDTDDGTCDSGHCSLREAILASNATSTGIDTIAFDIAGAGPHLIQPLSPLPSVTDPVVIDGYTEPGAAANTNGPDQGSNAVLMIEIDGGGAGTGVSGLKITSGYSTVRGLAITRYVRSGATGGNGIELWGSLGNTVEGCFIGTDVTGMIDRGNQNGGLFVYAGSSNTIGGLTPAARNVISGNDDDEVRIWGSNNTILGNFIGTDATGGGAVGPGGTGVMIVAGSGNLIGGDTAEARNLISGNGFGVRIAGSSAGTVIQGNSIGPGLSGSSSIGSGSGVYLEQQVTATLIGGTGVGHGNLISGNLGPAVQVNGNQVLGTVIQGNLIGTAADGSSPLGNGYAVSANNTVGLQVGGADPGAANTIAFNGVPVPPFGATPAIVVSSGSAVDIQANRIFDNQSLAIDLGNDGVTANDPGDGDTGANGLQNYPVLTAVTSGGAAVQGTLDSTASTQFRVDFYASQSCDPSGFGEGGSYLGSDTVTTDAGGIAAFTSSVATPAPAGTYVTAIATDPTGNSSEFSQCLEYDPGFVDLGITKSDGGTTSVPGATVAFSLSYINNGTTTATGVVLTDTVPADTTFNAASSTAGWTCVPDINPGSVCTLALGPVGSGAGDSAAFAVTVDNPLPSGVDLISNTASIADDGSSGADPNPADNTDGDTTPITAAPDLAIVKDDGGALPPAGSTLAYTLTYTNYGDQEATGIDLTDTVPANTTFDAPSSTAGWVCTPDTSPGSVCVLAVGSLAGGGADGNAVYAVVLDEPLPAGVSEITNTASVADDGGNGADPDPSDNSDTELTDAVPPTVADVDTIDTTGDGRLDDCETAQGIWISEILMTFSEPLYDPLGDTDPDDVTNPDNYLLVSPGPDLQIDTTACGPATGDDIAIPIAGVTYDNPTTTATLDVGSLQASQLRLMACGANALRDLAGRPLDGSGNGIGGDDFSLTFRADPRNSLANGHLDCDLSGWIIEETIPGATMWSPEDVYDVALSGSAEILNPSATGNSELFSLGQCTPIAAGGTVFFKQRLRLTAGAGDVFHLTMACEFHDGADCLGANLGASARVTEINDTSDAWTESAVRVMPPAGTISASCSTELATASTGAAFTAHFDRLVLSDDPTIFNDGFESGDLRWWSDSAR
jgi:CSLREA domain-containing protein/uncharacterized repeat protein (TIGR01451 family)